ncbi:MAG: carbohydrate-binding domain-containing protein, partial [Ruminococcus sp.]|nr:carbohydrate-binding domain-containing protein [Ruminococcus sp.]
MNDLRKKKMLAVLSSAALLTGMLPAATTAVQAADTGNVSKIIGDVNNDSKVTVADAVAILQYIANKDKYSITGQALSNADVYNRGDGVTARDALSIQRLDAKVITSLPESVMETSSTTSSAVTTTATTATTSATATKTTTTATSAVTTASTSATAPVADITYIHLKGDTASVIGEHAKVSGSVITIDHSGTYYVDGKLDNGQIEVNVADEKADPETVKIYLNGASITGKNAPALLITNAENTSVNIVDGTENTITDGTEAYAGDSLGTAVIEAKDDITIKGGDLGTGVLNITANTQDAVSCNNDIKFNGGVVKITTLNSEDKTDAVKGKSSVTVKDGTLFIEAEGDGIKSSKGSVAVSGGSVSIKAGNDAIQSGTSIDISGGTVIAGGDRGLTGGTALNITGGEVYATATDNQVDKALLEGSTRTIALLNCIDDTTNEKDGTWKKANVLSPSRNFDLEFTKKYKYVLISTSEMNGAKSCTFWNLSNDALATHTDGKQTQFQLGGINVFENVDPSGGKSNTNPDTPRPPESSDESSDTMSIKLNGSSITTDAPSDVASVSNGVLTIKNEAVFAITGEAKDVQIVVDVDKEAYPDAVVELDFMGASITNSATAPIFVNSIGDEVQIVAKAGTENTISDGTTHSQTYTGSDGASEAVEGAIFSRDDIKFKGNGTLNVNGNQDDAVVCKNDIKIYNGTLNINAEDDGIRGKDSITIGNSEKSDGSAADNSGLKLTVKAKSGDGIKSTATDTADDKAYGIVTINGGTIDITANLDGIQAEQNFVMNGGDLKIYTYQGSAYTGSGTTGGMTGGFGGFGGGRGGFGGMDGNSSKPDVSAKGIKAVGIYDEAGTTWQSKGNITINGGNISIDASDDCIHCGGDMNLIGGVYTLASADDGIHSDHNLVIGKGSASTYDDIKISVTKAYEGVEALNITQNSGTVLVTCTDDGFNAAGGNDGSGNRPGRNPWGQGGWSFQPTTSESNICMTFNGGLALANVSDGDHDGFDSNGSIKLNGGIQVSNGNEPFDCGDGGGYSVSANGSTWLSYYGSTMGDSLRSYASVSVSASPAAGTRISLVGSDGGVIASFMRGQKNVSKFYAGGTNTTGASYYTGGTVSGGTELIEGDGHGVIVGGKLSGGTKT